MILPNQTIGIIGGGQLGRMMAIAAKYMGYKIIVLDPAENCSTAQVADEQIIAKYDDLEAIKQLTDKSDVVTYEFENVDVNAAAYIEKQGKLPQGAHLLSVTQNRDKEKQLMTDLNIPVAPYAIVMSEQELEAAIEKVGYPAVLKTCRGGYDGKGQFKANETADLPLIIEFMHKQDTRYILEQWISFDMEISVVFTRSAVGEIEFFPVAENKHADHILDVTIAPARMNKQLAKEAKQAARKLADELGVVGTFAIEMFVQDDEIYMNEMAPRPHNSGHYTIEACNISQFAQHILAICGRPLQKVAQHAPAGMINILGEHMDPLFKQLPTLDNGFVHLYGKADAKIKRKMGHVTFLAKKADERDDVVTRFKEGLE